MTEPVWLDELQLAAIAHISVARFGGHSGEVRDGNLLKAAPGRPLNKWHYDEPKPDPFDLAAAYCIALSRGQVFPDGNKRAAYIVAMVFLELNGGVCAPAQEDIIRTMVSLAAGALEEAELAAWFRDNAEN